MAPMGICVYVCASVYINFSLWVPSSIKTNAVWTIFQESHNSCYGLFTGNRGINLTFNLFLKDLWSSLSALSKCYSQCRVQLGFLFIVSEPLLSLHISQIIFFFFFWSSYFMIQNPNLWMCEPPLRLSSFSFFFSIYLSIIISPSNQNMVLIYSRRYSSNC